MENFSFFHQGIVEFIEGVNSQNNLINEKALQIKMLLSEISDISKNIENTKFEVTTGRVYKLDELPIP